MKAGVASIAITPGEPMWLAGWAVRREPASGKSMDLFAKALALEDDRGRRMVILTADLIAISRELAASVTARVKLPRETVLFAASHTHNGPEVRLDKVPFFEIPAEYAAKIPPYVAGLEEKMAAVIVKALNGLEPVRLEFCKSSAGFAHNRRSADGPVAQDVPVLRVIRENNKPLAILFGYACHNLTLPPSFCEYHGDYAGVAGQTLEAMIPGATALFLAGAGADQNPAPRGTSELAAQHGRALAEAIANAIGHPIQGLIDSAFQEISLDFLPPPSVETLRSDIQSDDLPRVRKARYLLDARAAGKRFPTSYPCPIQMFGIGRELLLIALGGEPVVDYAIRLQREFAGATVWVAGYCNDMFGYLPTKKVQEEGGYEGARALLWSALPAPFTGTAEERIMTATRALAGKLQSSYPDPA